MYARPMRLVGVFWALTCAKTEAALESAATGETGRAVVLSGMTIKKRMKARMLGSVRWANILLAWGEVELWRVLGTGR